MAWVYRQYCKKCEYIEAEKYARENKLGIWSQPNPIPPWEFRRDSKTSKGKDWTHLYTDSCTASQIESNNGYSCGNKKYCTQMDSCDEAYYYYKNCSLKKLDRDSDGVPCESLCSG